MPTVINRHHFRGKSMPSPWMYIGRGTPLGNPFTKKEHGAGALEFYRRHLWDLVRGCDADVMRTLRSITADHHLVCSCAPAPCHGDVVVACWRWLEEAKQFLLRVDADSFCAGVVIVGGKVERAAPILRWMTGRSHRDVEVAALHRGWKLSLLP